MVSRIGPQEISSHIDLCIGKFTGSIEGASDHKRATSLGWPFEEHRVTFTETFSSLAGFVVESMYEPFLELKGET